MVRSFDTAFAPSIELGAGPSILRLCSGQAQDAPFGEPFDPSIDSGQAGSGRTRSSQVAK